MRSWLLTIDIEDYFQVSGFEEVIPRSSWGTFEGRVEQNTLRMLDILVRHDAHATFFVLGWIAKKYPNLIKRIHAAGHEIACHSFDHRLVYRCTPEEFKEDTRRAKHLMEALIGERVLGYRAPSFSITRKSLWALDVLAEMGFAYDSSIFPILRDRYGIPGAPRFVYRITTDSFLAPGGMSHEILEIPPATLRLLGVTLPLGGGGYFRLFPERAFRWGFERILFKEERPPLLYLHPWEIAPEQPVIRNGSRLSRFRQYVNLHKTEGRLRRLLARAPSVSIQAALAHLANHAEARTVGDLKAARPSIRPAQNGRDR